MLMLTACHKPSQYNIISWIILITHNININNSFTLTHSSNFVISGRAFKECRFSISMSIIEPRIWTWVMFIALQSLQAFLPARPISKSH